MLSSAASTAATLVFLAGFLLPAQHGQELPDSCGAGEAHDGVEECGEGRAPVLVQDRPTVAIKVVRGRLGNHLWGYLFSLGLQRMFQITPLVTEKTKHSLERYFKRVRFDAVESFECWNAYYTAFLRYVDETVINYVEAKVGHEITWKRAEDDGRLILPDHLNHLYPPSTNELIDRDPNFVTRFKPDLEGDCNKWSLFMSEIADLAKPEWNRNRYLHLYPGGNVGDASVLYRAEGVEDDFLEDLQFHDKFVDHAQKVLNSVRAEYLKRLGKEKKKKKKKEFLYVGIHCRRTDHLDYERRHSLVPLKPSYYLDAMDVFRRKFGKSHNILFLFVSDDMAWGREKLSLRNKERDLHFVGASGNDETAVGMDLALLAYCNHTIQSYGTFSFFAGFFAGGLRILPQHFREYRRPKEKGSKLLDKNPLENPLPRLFFSEDFIQK